MSEYVVRFLTVRSLDQRGECWFAFERDGVEHTACIAVTRQAAELLRRIDVDSERGTFLLGLPELERRFRAGVWPGDGAEPREVVFTSSPEVLDRFAAVVAHKTCAWQRRAPRGLLCDATAPGTDPRTTVPLCGGCAIPDHRMICRHLVHPEVHGLVAGGGLSRDAATALCDAGNEAGDGSECRPNGKRCWERVVTDAGSEAEPPTDVAKLAADEVDYFRLVYRDRYGASVLTVPQARSISEFFGNCDSEADFIRRVTALADLLAHLAPFDQLTAEQRTDAGRRVGSLVALKRLLERDYPAGVPFVESLRTIPTARRVFPIHSRTSDVVAAMRPFGIDYPATDWHDAWLRVLTVFWTSLRGVRAAIQSGDPPDDEAGEPPTS